MAWSVTKREVLPLAAAVALGGVAGCSTDRDRPYLERRAAAETRLARPGPAPPSREEPNRAWQLFPGDWEIPADRVREVQYRSGELDLQAWVFTPKAAETVAAPALVYLHPDVTGATPSWLRDTKPFIEAGFVIMLPNFRGEAGNPGHFEFAFGEVDDAAAAIRWLAAQRYVDAEHIYAFGWSYGGFISALLSLWDDVPLRHSASCGGLLGQGILAQEAALLPFDIADPTEERLRLLVGNLRWMQREHYAYMGTADDKFFPAIVAAKREMKGRPSLLEIDMVPGAHFAAGTPGMLRYMDIIRRERAAERQADAR